jgi:hypothetical protein
MLKFRYPPRFVDLLIPVLVTGIQPDQVLGLKELFPRRRRGTALISVTSTEMTEEEKLQTSDRSPALDHDVFRSGRPKNMNVIDSKKLERDAGGKPHTLFLIPL